MDPRVGPDPPGFPESRNTSWPRLAYIRPGANAHSWLAGIIREIKGDDPFRPVTVLVPNDYAGQLVRWNLARQGGYLNVSTLRVPQLAAAVASDGEDGEPRRIATIVEESAVRASLALHDGALREIEHRSLHVSLLEFFREIRRREVDFTGIDPDQMTPTTRAALEVYRQFTHLLDKSETTTSIANAATHRLTNSIKIPQALDSLGTLVLWLPSRLDPAEARLLAAAARWVPLVAGFVGLGNVSDLTDAPGYLAAAELANALGRDPPVAGPETANAGSLSEIRIIRAPDPPEEVREVVRAIAAAIEAKVPLHRVAVVYRQGDPYAALVRNALAAAGIPWVSSEGLRLTDTRPGRCLLGLLGLRNHSFTREALMEWLETGPILDEPIAAISSATWDRLTRAANVVRGAAQWDSRLRALAWTLEDEATKLTEADGQPTLAAAKRRQAADAGLLANFVVDLEHKLRSPATGKTWAAFVDWARVVRDLFVGTPDKWPAAQREAAAACDEVLTAVRRLDRIEWVREIDLPTFLGTLEGALDARRIPTGRFGEGIVVEPVTALNGLAFDRVYVLGLVDGAFPPAPAPDPYFLAGGPDPLNLRPRQVAKERQDFLIALAAADGGRLTLTTPDSDSERATIPSRWLLEQATACKGVTLDASTFGSQGEDGNTWLRVIRSAQDAVRRAEFPADLEDRRLGFAANWATGIRRLEACPLGLRANLPLSRAIAQRRTRSGPTLTRFDGNVSERAATSQKLRRLVGSRGALSASAIQSWATCGYQFFLDRVIGVEPTEKPEESPTIDALERGTLIHTILEQFFAELTSGGRSVGFEAYGHDDVAGIERIAAKEFAELERRGVAGHPLVWENAKGQILADLRSFLTVDSAWRATEMVAPTRFEQAFGLNAHEPGNWPALEVPVGESRLLFRGKIDRIDIDATGARAVVFDYKTGSAFRYVKLDEDPVLAGQHIQLALYSQVIRQNLPLITDLRAAFWFITSKGDFKRVPTTYDAGAAASRLKTVLGIIAEGIRSGAFPQVPGAWTNGNHTNCAYCDFDQVCPARRDRLARDKVTDPFVVLHASLARASEPEE